MSDSFRSRLAQEDCTVSDDKKSIIIMSLMSTRCAFLKNVVSSGVHKWTFKINQDGDGNAMYIGVWKAKYGLPAVYASVNSRKLQSKGKSYSFCMSHARLSKGDKDDGEHDADSWGSRVEVNDTITMKLDLDNRTISFVVNDDEELGTAFENIEKTSYRAAVASYEIAEYELISYSTNNGDDKQNNDDNKCNQCDQYVMDINSLKNQIKSLETKNDKFQKQVEKLQQEKKEMNESNIKLNEECKEMEISLNEMTRKYNKLYRKQNLNENNYLEWDYEDVADWIINLNPEFEIYADILKNTLKEEQVDGAILNELDKNDIHRFGIKQIKHKIEIIKGIQRITNPNKEKQSYSAAIPQNDEGNDVAPTAYI